MKEKLKIGLLVNTLEVSSIDYHMIKSIHNSDFAEVGLIAINNGSTGLLDTKIKRTGIHRILEINYFLVIKYLIERILKAYLLKREKKYFSINETSNNLKELIKNVHVINVTPVQTKFKDVVNDADLKSINEYKPDVLIRCGFRILSGGILNIAKYGIWSFHHGDNDYNRGGPAGFWEFYEKWNKTGSILQILTEDLDNGLIIGKTFSKTDEISHHKNIHPLYIKTSLMLLRKLKELYSVGGDKFMDDLYKQNDAPNFYDNRLFKKPDLSVILKLVLRDLKFRFDSILKLNVKSNQWMLMYNFQNSISSSFWRFKKMVPPSNMFWADPFVVYHEEEHYIFLEEFDYGLGRGHISYIKLNSSGEYNQPVTVLKKDYHLSYPYIFNHEGTYYMIPETNEKNSIDLYYCDKFPNNWQFKKTLIDGINAHDASIIFKDNVWWLFVNVVENEFTSPNDELFIYYADDLFSDEWKSHPKNPVISDVESARCAGKLFFHKERLYRPSQNCTKHYGYGLNINKIEKLNTQEYSETIIKQIHPNWSNEIEGIHTINSDNGLVVIDVIANLKLTKNKRH